ncbi:hypothetical protein FM038_013410 [Shewanella eurypsychrophilus]|uniref:Metallo-beta-lactamase domain-containing protein n=1 Tax=Shewanella eurypsychrophilus TaxID=2593656 RepID=A0ABX6V941_9GAMM|nr:MULTISPECIES: hypothetical protein [Shewanella]QFU23049.1 hypothetical protein FS418_14990 [Shewanella sp. YLB-09]QPG58332.1 hypothetical protein FM038_013410 [Shewanella eurypsychrophilus]
MKYYAFLEEIERTGEQLTVVLDAIPQEVVFEGKIRQELDSIRTFQFELVIIKKDLRRRYNKKTLMLNRWYELTTSRNDDGIKGIRYSLEDEQVLEMNIDFIKVLDRRNRLQKELMKSSSLDFLSDATSEEITNCLPVLKVNQNILMKVMDVGQGNSIAFMENEEFKDLFYVDVGGGIMRNRGTYKDNNVSYNPQDNALIVLTHWDMDHWVSLIRKPNMNKTKLLVPRQKPLGLSHVKLAAKLASQDRLLIWPDSKSELNSDLLDIHKLKKHKNRNYSGLVVVAKTDHAGLKNTLITGDAPYKKCDFLGKYDINTVVVPHHGGNFSPDKVPSAPNQHIAIYSYGTGNSYGHPHQLTLDNHHVKGWTNKYITVGNDIIISNQWIKECDSYSLRLQGYELVKYF